jgi:hypothetical protein
LNWLRNVRFLTYIAIAAIAVVVYVSWKRVIPVALASSGSQPGIPHGVYYRFDRLAALPPPFSDAGSAVLAAVKKEGLNPEVYFIELRYGDPDASALLFDLWDARAFPIAPGAKGNPGGDCRTVEYDPAKKVVTRIYGWR